MIRRLVTTKWVVSQVRNGHAVSQPTTTSQTPQMTPNRIFLVSGCHWLPSTTPLPSAASPVNRSRLSTGRISRFQCGCRCSTTFSPAARALSG